jgi:signal transduction histidine kinase
MGMGLSICHGIVKRLGGEIQVESAVGQGSVFRVVLPPHAA